MANVTIKIVTDCSLWRAELHNTANNQVVRLPNISGSTTMVPLDPGPYYVSFSSFANLSTATATISASTSAQNKVSETYGVSDDGTLLEFFGFTVTNSGEVE